MSIQFIEIPFHNFDFSGGLFNIALTCIEIAVVLFINKIDLVGTHSIDATEFTDVPFYNCVFNGNPKYVSSDSLMFH